MTSVVLRISRGWTRAVLNCSSQQKHRKSLYFLPGCLLSGSNSICSDSSILPAVVSGALLARRRRQLQQLLAPPDLRQPVLSRAYSTVYSGLWTDYYACHHQCFVRRRSKERFGFQFGLLLLSTTTHCAIMSQEKPNVVFVLGGPGAGKGTQCQKIVEVFGYVHLSAGDLLREERNRPNSEFGELIETNITNGTIVPVEITCSLLARAMREAKTNDFLIDGFPRNEDNLQGWTKEMGDKVNVKFVLFYKCDQDTCVQRCLGRGAAGSGRSDDNMESLKKRFDTYINATMPIVDHFRKLNLVVEIDATKSPEEVFEETKKHFTAK